MASVDQTSMFEDTAQQIESPAKVEFLAGLFATWQLGGQRKPTKKERDALEGVARDTLIRVQKEVPRSA